MRNVTKVAGVMSALERWDANILCCAETQTAWEKCFVREQVEREMRRNDQYAGFVGSSSESVTSEAYKPGGTMMVLDGNWACRSKKYVDSYKLGRWTYVTLCGRNNAFLTIITAYRCCAGQSNKNVGTHSSYMQQEILLKRRGVNKTPQEMFIIDLIKLINELSSAGHEILLNLDANELWDSNGSRIRELATRTGLVDIAAEKHVGPVPATYSRANSSRRIDYMLATEGFFKNVRAMGIAPKRYDPILGDHRPQYVDINIHAILHLNAHDIESPTSRKLKSSNPKSVDAYTKTTKSHFLDHNIFQRMERLWVELEKRVTMSPIQIAKYEAIDRDVYRLCTSAENQLRKISHTRYVWSPALDEAVKAVQHWNMRRKYFANTIKSCCIIKEGKEKGMGDDEDMDYEEITSELEQAYAGLKEVQKKDKEKRVEFLDNLAEKYASDNKIDKETAVRELMDHEDTRELYRTIRLKMEGPRSPQMSEVWLQGGNGDKVVLSEANEVEDHLLTRNWKHLRQAKATPFADGTMGDLLNFDGTGEVADKIVNGEDFPELESMSNVVQKYIKGMSVSDPSITDSVDVNITLEEYQHFWKHKRESTVTSPYGLHIGHYRSVLQKESEDIMEVHRKLLVIPFKFAMIPDRWAQTIQILLEKDSGSPWTHRLRIIELFDSQVNAGLQIIFGKRMVSNALKHNLIHPSTYGSVPLRTAQDAVLEKVLSLDIMRIRKISGAIFDCDAKSCYDRIIAALQSITCRRLGIPRTTSMFFARFWSVCRHYVRTRHGTSSDFFVSTATQTLYGIGQGNGAGPAFWLSNLIVMFTILNEVCKGMRFKSPWKRNSYKSMGLGYVDDVTLGCTTQSEVGNEDIIHTTVQEEQEVIEEITAMGQTWETMLNTNGGLLELKKCYWILLSWKWVKGIATLKNKEEVEAQMRIRQTEKNDTIIIPRKSVQDAPRVLGCHVAADGSWRVEVGKWSTEGARFAHKVRHACFTRICGTKMYPSIWLARLRYISSVVGFTAKESSKINNPVVFRCLPASGYNSHFPREVVYGPARYGGLEWETCWSVQIMEKLKFAMTHMRREDKLGHLLTILIECVQLQSGLSSPILETNIKWDTWVERTWLSSLKEGLDAINGKLVTNCKTPPKQRKFDRAIMEIFYSWNLTTKELMAINRCRIHLQVIFISDLTDYTGRHILDEIFQVRQVRPSVLQWSRQVRPILGDRRIWEKYLKRLCYGENNLITTLGKWIEKPHQLWPYMTTENNLYLLRNIGGVQKKMGRIDKRKYRKKGTVLLQVERGYPTDCVPIPSGYKVKEDVFEYVTQFGRRSKELNPKNVN